MKIYEIVSAGTNPTVTPKSSDFIGQQKSNNIPTQMSAKDKAIAAIVRNHKKNMIDRPTAEKQLKGQGIQPAELNSFFIDDSTQ